MSAQENFAIVGLTGGIASGKSLVADRFVQLGVALVDADQLARQVVEPGKPAWVDIRHSFGDQVIRADQTLDRGALAAIVFRDDVARRKLEAITHPHIAQALVERAGEFRAAGHPWMIYDAALLVENRAQHWLHGLIVVAVDPQVQLERLMQRDGFSAEEALQRIAAQMPLADKIAVADFVIDNNHTRDHTLAQVDRIHEEIGRRVRQYGSARDPQHKH